MFAQPLEEVKSDYNYSIQYGVLCNPFDRLNPQLSELRQICEDLATHIRNENISNSVKNITMIDHHKIQTYEDQMEARLYLTYLSNAYLVETKSSILPKELSVPLYKISRDMGIKVNIAVQTAKNYLLKRELSQSDPLDLKWQDLKLKVTFTNSETENYLMLGSVYSNLVSTNIINYLYHINHQIATNNINYSLIQCQLGYINEAFKTITNINYKLLQKIDPSVLNDSLRKYLKGWDNVVLEGIPFTSCEQDNRYNNPITEFGGSGGTDPTFQIIQRALGINFLDDNTDQKRYEKFQKALRRGMCKKHCDLIGLFERESKVRQLCKQNEMLKSMYNEILINYCNFVKLHGEFVQKFIIRPNLELQGKKGQYVSTVFLKDSIILRDYLLQ